MKQSQNYYACLRHELFEILIPRMLYQGTEEENFLFFQLMVQEKEELIREMFRTLCEDDGVPCPCHTADFETEALERGGIQILKILPPAGDPETSDILRAYLMYTEKGDGSLIVRYFVVRRFEDGGVFILNITPEMEELLGEELTAHTGDMEYEYWRLIRDFARVMIRDMRTGKEQEQAGSGRMEEGSAGMDLDGVITPEQWEAFFRWLQEKESDR